MDFLVHVTATWLERMTSIPADMTLSRPFTDHIFKNTPSGPLHLRLWVSQAPQPVGLDSHPLAFYLHGGAWMHGQHTLPAEWMLKAFTEAGFHFVSSAYRLAPHVSLMQEMEDCLDAWRWCRDHLPRTLEEIGAPFVDPARWVSMGQSAGANLSMMMGHFAAIQEKPYVVFDGFGQVSFLDPQSYPEEPITPAPRSDLTVEQIIVRASSRDQRQACSWCPEDILEHGQTDAMRIHHLHDDTYDVKLAQHHSDVVQHIFNQKQLYEAVMRKEECASELEWHQRLQAHSMLSQVDETFPPTVILHGEKDEVVDVERTRALADRLRWKGVAVEE